MRLATSGRSARPRRRWAPIAWVTVGFAVTLSAGAAPAAQAASSLFSLREGSRMTVSAPAGFFGSGSPAVQRTVSLAGRRLGDIGPFELGDADTVLDADGSPPAVGSRRSLRFGPAEITWRGRRSIAVPSVGGTRAWAVRVDLSSEAPQPLGRITLRRTGSRGGTFDASFSLLPRITFTSPGRRLVLDLGRPGNATPLTFNARGVPWRVSCPRSVRGIPRLGGRICLGAGATGGVTWTARSTAGPARLVLGSVAARRHRSARIARSARIGRNVTLGRNASIGPSARIGDGAVIGPRARVGARAVVGRLAIVGKRAVVGARARLGSRAVVDANAVVRAGARLATRAVVGSGSRIDGAAAIGARSRLGSSSRVGAGASIGRDVTAGRGVSIGVGATATRSAPQSGSERTSVADGTFLAEGAIVARGTSLSEDLITCIPPPSPYQPVFERPVTVEQCGGAVNECVRSTVTRRDPAPETQVTPTPGIPAGLGGQLATDVGSDVAPPRNGGTGQPYVRGEHDCIDYADELERKLTRLGYDATFTIIWRLNPDKTWYNGLWTDKWINGHCVTDVHRPGGTILWIEPQFTAGSQPAGGVNLDYDGDGTVGVSEGRPVDHTTDDGYRIEVYDSREAARAAGANVR